MNLKKLILLLFISTLFQVASSQENQGVINIDTKNGHAIKIGASGFNVRIADKSWSFLHPDFRKAVHQLKPGWLRYFSGTMGDAFSSATGQYDIDYAMMFDHHKEYLKGYRFTEVKGPHRIIDLYQLLGEINGKLVITVNGFTETPEMTLELARFCKNNNIEVATWQFCNEPYFYVPHRERYWWNNGYDYAAKMKPHADAIKSVYPDAFLTLNSTWDGIWGFMKEINSYQKKNGAYWNVFSKHSYAPHAGKRESIDDAYKRANTKLLEATSNAAMEDIQLYNSKDIPMVITEFGVWNKPLNGIYSSIYNIEYVMRQLKHKNTWYVGAHEVSSKYTPEKNINIEIEAAYKKGIDIKTDTILTGIKKTLEGKAYEIFHEVTNHSNFIFDSNVTNGFMVPGLKNRIETGFATQAYRGINGFDYLVFTNRSDQSKDFKIIIDGVSLNKQLEVRYITADSLGTRNTEIQRTIFKKGKINIPRYSVSIAKWKSKLAVKPTAPTIYKAEITGNGIELNWGGIESAKKYTIFYKENSSDVTQELVVKNNSKHTIVINNLNRGSTYHLKIKAKNQHGTSAFSNEVIIKNAHPGTPEIFKTSRRNATATIFWKSVPSASGYRLKYVNTYTGKETIVEANNVYGYRVEGLEYKIPYNFYIAAYNGIGVGAFSKAKSIVLSEKVPLSPRNVSAIRDLDGSAAIKWVEQDSILPETTYNVYRGEKLHKYSKIARGIKESFFKDTLIDKNKIYFYTVKAETIAGESNFYPNTATLLGSDDKYSIKIIDMKKKKDGFLFKIEFKNIAFDKNYLYGIKIENISYLTVEETLIEGKNISQNMKTFDVYLKNSELNKKSKYAIKAFIKTKDKMIYSKLPHKIIKTD